MSRQTKKKYINKDKIKINKLQNKIYDLEFLLKTKHNACDELLQDNKQLKRDLEFREALIGVYEDGNKKVDKAIEIYKEKINKLQKENENYKDQIENKDKTIERLKAQNYSLKKRSFLERVFNT